MGYSPRGRKESDTTEQLHFHFLLSEFNLESDHSFVCHTKEIRILSHTQGQLPKN